MCPNCIWLFNYTPINFIENVPQDAKDFFGTKFYKNLILNTVPKESFFVASDVGTILYNKPINVQSIQSMYWRSISLKRLFIYIFLINAHISIKKQSN